MFSTYSKEDLESQADDSVVTQFETPESELQDKYDLNKCIKWIKENNYQRTCLQFPESLLNDSTSVAIYLQNILERPVYVLADTSYGSCCVDEVAAEHVDADSIIHFGHACLSPVVKLPVLYVFEKKKLNVNSLYKSCEHFHDLIIFYDDAFHHYYSEICSVFKEKKNVRISCLCLSDTENGPQEKICGRIYVKSSQGEVSAVYIGEDSMTLQNLILGLPDLKWYRYSTEGNLEEYKLNRNKFLMRRSHLVEKIREANVIGILIGTLGIKDYLDAVDKIKFLIKQNGKKYYTLAVGKPNSAKLANFPEIDVFVYIACQENSLLKDFKDYYKPVVSLFEMANPLRAFCKQRKTSPEFHVDRKIFVKFGGLVEIALGNRPYSVEYTSDFRQLLPGGSFYKKLTFDSVDRSNSKETSQELLEKNPGTIIEYGGANFLANRTWRGLEQNGNEVEVSKAVKGRTGIPQAYENELETLSEEKPS